MRFYLLFVLMIGLRITATHGEPYAATVHWSDGTVEEICALDRGLCEDPRWAMYLLPRDPRSGAHIVGISRCVPKACILARENCIVGYHGPRKEGYCR